MKLYLFCIPLFLLSLLFCVSPSFSAEQLDLSFGDQGISLVDLGNNDDQAFAIAVQDDGKILVAGFSDNGSDTDMAVARYNQDGSPDRSFNFNGQVTYAVGSGDDSAFAIAVQPDGKILLGGISKQGDHKVMAFVRLQDNGNPDLDFGDGGQAVFSPGTGDSTVYEIAVSDDGYIVAAGVSEHDKGRSATLLRLTPYGALDKRFGSSGIALVDPERESAAYTMMVQEDGSVVAAGYGSTEGGAQVGLFRFRSDGTVDSGFGEKGVVTIAASSGDSAAYDIITQLDGKIVITGFAHNGSYRDFLLIRLHPDGSADYDFGDKGIVITSIGHDAVAYALEQHNDGTLFAAGYASNGTDKDFALLEYNPNGLPIIPPPAEDLQAVDQDSTSVSILVKPLVTRESLDKAGIDLDSGQTVATASFVVTDIDDGDDQGQAILLTSDGYILAAGFSSNGKDDDFALVRYIITSLSHKSIAGGLSSNGYYISTTAVTNVTRVGAASGGAIISQGGTVSVTRRGVCYGITPYPVYSEDSGDDDSGDDSGDDVDDGDGDDGEDTETAFVTRQTEDNTFGNLDISDKEYLYNTVTSGSTSDGAGTGQFRSDIKEITPDTWYYVRAYAVLSDGSVIYGNQQGFQSEDACFIATAAFGSPINRHVSVMRKFRDRIMKPFVSGRHLISVYYHYSPPMADIISDNKMLRAATVVLLLPFIAVSYLAVYPLIALKIALTLLLAAAFSLFIRSLWYRSFFQVSGNG